MRVGFGQDIPVEQAWKRWYNRAVKKSVSQLKRAVGWIKNHPDRIFFDAKCEKTFDLINDKSLNVRIYAVAIANGASEQCIRFFEGGSGSLVVSPSENPDYPQPFSIGNPGGDEIFVHVFDESHLHIILRELDTVRDFTDYLDARKKVIENENLFMAASEEDLLAVYLKDINENGEHDFVWESGVSLLPDQKIVVEEGSYRNFQVAGPYKRKKIADKKSYLWDRLIEKFSSHLSSGTLAEVPFHLGDDGRDGKAEIGLRYMALETRFRRRSHAEAILGAFETIENRKGNRFFRAMIPENEQQGDTGFCILLVKREIMPEDTTYDDYRELRAATLSAYTEGLLERNRHLRRVIGIATEGVRSRNMSEDMVYHEAPEWTDEQVENAKERAKAFHIFQSGMYLQKHSALEYPVSDLGLRGGYQPIPYQFFERPGPPKSKGRGNRHQRRTAKARYRSRRK